MRVRILTVQFLALCPSAQLAKVFNLGAIHFLQDKDVSYFNFLLGDFFFNKDKAVKVIIFYNKDSWPKSVS